MVHLERGDFADAFGQLVGGGRADALGGGDGRGQALHRTVVAPTAPTTATTAAASAAAPAAGSAAAAAAATAAAATTVVVAVGLLLWRWFPVAKPRPRGTLERLVACTTAGVGTHCWTWVRCERSNTQPHSAAMATAIFFTRVALVGLGHME